MRSVNLAIVWCLVLVACGAGSDEATTASTGLPLTSPTSLGAEPATSSPVIDKPTFHRDVRPLVEANCVGCHSPGQIAPFAFDTPEAMLQLQELIVTAIEDRTMPPWGLNPDCHDTVGDLRLADEQVAMVQAWREQGFVVGDEADYVAPVLPEAVDVGPPDVVRAPDEPYP